VSRRQEVTAQEPYGNSVIQDTQDDKHSPTFSDADSSELLPRELCATPDQSRSVKEDLTSCPLCARRKGILKKVRFDEVYGPIEEENYKEDVVAVGSTFRDRHLVKDVYYESPLEPRSSPFYPSALPSPAPPPPPPPPPPIGAPQPPTIFNKAIEQDEYLNAAALRLYTSFMDELSEFVLQQDEVIRMRLAVQERRKELHRLREDVSKCDMMLINCMRERVNGSLSSDDRTMLHLFEASQAARDEIGPIESEYEPLEIRLGSKEHQLVEKYARLEGAFEHFFRLNMAPVPKPKESSEIEYEASSVASAADENVALGDTERLYGALIGEDVVVGQLPKPATQLIPGVQESWVPDDSRRRAVSLGSSDIPRPRSNNFADEWISMDQSTGTLDFVGIWTTEQAALPGTGTASQERHDDESVYSRSNYIEISDASPDFMDSYPVNPGLEEGNPLLLLGENDETCGILSDYLVNFESTPDRVNRWILHQLRISPREIYRLHRSIGEYKEEPFLCASSVLIAWPHDGLGYDNPYHQGSVELEEDIGKVQALGYHGACSPGSGSTHNWPSKDAGLVHQSSTFSASQVDPNLQH
jgi:hypothetical protein